MTDELIRKADVPSQVLPTEIQYVNEFKGCVRVNAVSLRQRLDLAKDVSDGVARMETLLSICVVDADGAQVYSPQEWSNFAARHINSAMMLFDRVRYLSGYDDAVVEDQPEKKDDSDQSLDWPVLSLSDLDAPSGS